MPHDAKGNLLQVGDAVSINAIIKSIFPGAEYCNLKLELEYPMYPNTTPYITWLNAKQVNKVDSVNLIENNETREAGNAVQEFYKKET